MRQYLADIAQYPALSHEEELRLLQVIDRGAAARDELEAVGPDPSSAMGRKLRQEVDAGREAQRTLTLSNLQLVVEIARTYRQSDRSLLGLVQEGNAGLPQGIETFDLRTGQRTFHDHITAAIRDAIVSSAW